MLVLVDNHLIHWCIFLFTFQHTWYMLLHNESHKTIAKYGIQ